LSVEEFQAQYELEPTMLENLLASQEAYKAMGLDLDLESVYAVEIDPPQNQAEDEETEQE
jgi:hypothetical protein